jgi:hypothetical protein
MFLDYGTHVVYGTFQSTRNMHPQAKNSKNAQTNEHSRNFHTRFVPKFRNIFVSFNPTKEQLQLIFGK